MSLCSAKFLNCPPMHGCLPMWLSICISILVVDPTLYVFKCTKYPCLMLTGRVTKIIHRKSMKTHKCTEIILKHFKSSEITYTYSYNLLHLKFDRVSTLLTIQLSETIHEKMQYFFNDFMFVHVWGYKYMGLLIKVCITNNTEESLL